MTAKTAVMAIALSSAAISGACAQSDYTTGTAANNARGGYSGGNGRGLYNYAPN